MHFSASRMPRRTRAPRSHLTGVTGSKRAVTGLDPEVAEIGHNRSYTDQEEVLRICARQPPESPSMALPPNSRASIVSQVRQERRMRLRLRGAARQPDLGQVGRAANCRHVPLRGVRGFHEGAAPEAATPAHPPERSNHGRLNWLKEWCLVATMSWCLVLVQCRAARCDCGVHTHAARRQCQQLLGQRNKAAAKLSGKRGVCPHTVQVYCQRHCREITARWDREMVSVRDPRTAVSCMVSGTSQVYS